MNLESLAGIHVMVTGGGTGIGAAIARKFAESGADVTICSRNIETLNVTASAHGMRAVAMDVTDPESVRRSTEAAVSASGPIRVHVANAGIAEGMPFAKMDFDFWRKTMATNLDGAFLSIRESLTSMRQAGWGRIIAISSIAGLRGLKNASAYTASKHALVGLVRALSEELAGSEITVNALCPGYVDTPLVARNVSVIAQQTKRSQEEVLSNMTRVNPHKRLVTPEEVADAALWLCRPESGSLNGLAIPITGGHL